MMWTNSFVVMSRVVEVFKMTIVLDNNCVNAQLKILAILLLNSWKLLRIMIPFQFKIHFLIHLLRNIENRESLIQ